jgi:hypothetical protein
VLPRAQSAQENCAIASLATIPTGKRDLLTVGAFQAGTYVVDFGDPARPKTVAWHDPEALDPASLSFGGSWGSFWYRGFVYASDVTRGLDVFRLEDRSVKAKAVRVDFLNPTDADLGAAREEEEEEEQALLGHRRRPRRAAHRPLGARPLEPALRRVNSQPLMHPPELTLHRLRPAAFRQPS